MRLTSLRLAHAVVDGSDVTEAASLDWSAALQAVVRSRATGQQSAL